MAWLKPKIKIAIVASVHKQYSSTAWFFGLAFQSELLYLSRLSCGRRQSIALAHTRPYLRSRQQPYHRPQVPIPGYSPLNFHKHQSMRTLQVHGDNMGNVVLSVASSMETAPISENLWMDGPNADCRAVLMLLNCRYLCNLYRKMLIRGESRCLVQP